MNNAAIDPRARAARRHARVHALRMRVAVGAVTTFLALWGVLFVQLATGHDPGLSSATTTAIVQSADPATAASTSAPGSVDRPGSADGAVTTSQS